MRILHFISSPAAGGAEVYIKDLAKALAESGHEVHIGFLESAAESGRCRDFQEHFLSELDDFGIGYFFVGRAARWMPLLGIGAVRSYVQKHEIDIYHSHLIYGAVFGALVSVPRVYTHHSVEMRRNRFLFAAVSRFIDQFVGISEVCTRALLTYTRRSVTTIFNGVDAERVMRGDPKLRQAGDTIRCISVGRICDDKNFPLLVRALSRLPEDVLKRLTVKIVGEGSVADTDHLRHEIRVASLEDTVHLLGVRMDIPELLKRSHIFLMSSSSEGLPIALLEAAISGLPCLVTNVGGCGEVVNMCQNGIVVAPGDEQAMADAIVRIVQETKLLSEFSANALRRAHFYSIDNACTSHSELYRRLLRTPDDKSGQVANND